MAKTLMKGSEAIAEAAIRAGCRYFFGYPITPQNEVPEYMAARMPQVGGCFVQSESEIAAINMVYGAAATGVRAMTSSSSPGISLKLEGISYLAGAELPCVIVNVVRGGPGLGGIQASQGDYFQAVKGGGHGDYHCVVYAPATIQETVDLMGLAFDVADRYRTPVMLLADGIIGQMMEPVELPELREYVPHDKPWAARGWRRDNGRARTVINSLYIEVEELSAMTERLQSRYAEIRGCEVLAETYGAPKGEIVLCAYGTVARICKEAVDELNTEGIPVTLVRPITLWPFPEEAVRSAAARPGVEAVLTVELSAGQMVEDVRLAVNGAKRVEFLGHSGSQMPTVTEIKEKIRSIRGD